MRAPINPLRGSYGGAIALELARQLPASAITPLVLYEPAAGVAHHIPADRIDELARLVDVGQPGPVPRTRSTRVPALSCPIQPRIPAAR
jgi:pimeloyl-ACP methyl ester carboxylesterase